MTKKKKHNNKTQQKDYLLIAVLCISLLGILLSGYLTYGHYTTTAEFCIGGEKGGSVRCDVVNQSVYAEVFGVPVALLGFFGYTSMAFFSYLLLYGKKRIHKKLSFLLNYADAYVLAFAWFSFAMKLYFNYLQFFVLKTICVLCEVSAAFVVILVVLSALRIYRKKVHPEQIKMAVFYFLILAVYMSLFIVLSINYTFYRDTNLDSFAQCLATKGVEMYGTFWCPSCGQVKKTLGSSYQYISYVECDPQGENSQTERCLALEIDKYPTWIDQTGNRLNAEKNIAKVSAFYHCPLLSEVS